MRIDKHTKTKRILPLLTKETLEDLLAKVPAMPLRKPLLQMTVGEFADILEDETQYIANILAARKAFKAFGRLKQFRIELEQIQKFMKLYDHTPSQEEKAAEKGVRFPSFGQRMLIDCVKFFGLHSFKEAEKVPLSEWLTVFQSEASSVLYQRNYQRIMEQKQKLKNNKKR